jgi:hypothetical protein
MGAHEGATSLLSQHAWLLFILGTGVIAAQMWARAKPRMAEAPHLVPGYRRLVLGWLVLGNVPWVVMGFGSVVGGVPAIPDFLRPRIDPYVVAFYVPLGLLWGAGLYWVWFRGGAEALSAYPEILGGRRYTPRAIQVTFSLMVLVLAVSILWRFRDAMAQR